MTPIGSPRLRPGLAPADASPCRRRLLRFAGWLALANAALLCLFATRYYRFTPLPGEGLGRLFTGLMVPAHFLALALPPLAVVALATLLRPGRWILGLGVGLYTFLAVLVLVDTQIYALYRFHFNAMVWSLLTSGVADEILPISGLAALQSTAVVAAIAALQTGLARGLWSLVGRRPRLGGRAVAAGLAGVIVGAHALHAWADAYLYTPITRQMTALPWLDGLTAHHWMERAGWVASPNSETRTVPFSESALAYPLSPPDCEPLRPPRNVLIVVIEEWRADEMGPVTSPHVWQLAQQRGVWFRNHFSSGNASRYGVFGLMYGLHGTYWDAMLAEQRGPVLVEEALRQGYEFHVRASAPLSHPEFDRTVFSPLRGEIPLGTPGERASERDRTVADGFLAFLEERSARPFFGFLFFDSPHAMDHPDDWPGPHAPARDWGSHLDLDDDTDPVPLANRHHNAVNYVDSLVGEVLDALEARGLLDDTAIVIAGDHGEEFNELGLNYWGHNSNFARYQVGVGLVVAIPGREPERVDRPTSHVDVAPTLLQEALGCRTPAELLSNGRSLFDETPRTHRVASGGSIGIGILEPDRLTLIERSGRVRLVDPELRELDGQEPDPERVAAVMDEMSRFFAR